MSEQLPVPNSNMSRSKLVIGALLWTAVFTVVAILWQQRHKAADGASESTIAASTSKESDPGTQANPIKPGNKQASVKLSFPARKLPDFTFDECMGDTLSLDDLKGKPWVASFVFTRCSSTCPQISAAVMRLFKQVKDDNSEVMLVTFTVDPKYDTTEVLKTYSEIFMADHDRWKFVTGEQQAIFELVVNGFGLYVKENLGEMRLPGFEVAHSNRVVLVNPDGIPVGTFLGTREEDMVKLRRILTGRADFPEPGPALSFSSADGSPLQIQFEVQPANPEESDGESDGESAGDKSDNEAEDLETASPPSTNNQSGAAGENPDGPSNASSLPTVKATSELSAAEHNAFIDERMPAWTRRLPSINAALNTMAAILLMAGFFAIRNERKSTHRNLMIAAFATSVVFLACYLLYHYQLGQHTGKHGKRFPGEGIFAVIYYLILVPHIVLAALVPFLSIRVFQHAFAERWDAHRWLARITFPIWMFVSITGVMIYSMLYHWPWPATTQAVAAV